jgi:NAD-dependent dihydropyrimidine dehydrogenase PreA subunit/nitroreductase
MVKIDLEKCTGCGICFDVCHEHCIEIRNKKIEIDFKYCSTCSQCIAVCPGQALSWNGVRPVKFDPKNMPSPVALDELFKERRTTRKFSGKKIDRGLLKEIVNYAVYAPAHNFNLRAVIIDDQKIIRQIDKALFKFTMMMYKFFYKPALVEMIIRLITPHQYDEYLKVKPKLETAFRQNRIFSSEPAVIILLVADKRIYLTLESAQYALYNIDLYAQAKGLACRSLVGNQMLLSMNKDIRNTLRLNRHEKIFGTLAVGYPAIKFRNKVEGRSINIQWNSGE